VLQKMMVASRVARSSARGAAHESRLIRWPRVTTSRSRSARSDCVTYMWHMHVSSRNSRYMTYMCRTPRLRDLHVPHTQHVSLRTPSTSA